MAAMEHLDRPDIAVRRDTAGIDQALKLALDELRMQMLGAQVLFGFQFQALFQEGFDAAATLQRVPSAVGLAAIVSTLALLIAAPCLHRLAQRGEATPTMLRYVSRCMGAALATLAVALACDVFLVIAPHYGSAFAWTAAGATLLCCGLLWYCLALAVRPRNFAGARAMTSSDHRDTGTSLHSRIDYLLTETRVILPGVQALLGFQLVVTMTQRFESMSAHLQDVHFAGLGLVTLTVLLLIAPAAMHRLGFGGEDDERFLKIGSRIVTLALLPLALGLVIDLYLAASLLYADRSLALVVGAVSLTLLLSLWYAVPCWLRDRQR